MNDVYCEAVVEHERLVLTENGRGRGKRDQEELYELVGAHSAAACACDASIFHYMLCYRSTCKRTATPHIVLMPQSH